MARTRGVTIWLTGLSGSGKSTLASALAPRLRERGLQVETLDGDEVRTNLSKDLGFSKDDRDTNIRRIGYVARLLSRNSVVVIAAAISPYRDIRDEVRSQIEGDGTPFIETYIKASLETLVDRDVKGLYKKAIAGEIAHFTGISDPYEAPLVPEVTVDTEHEGIEESVEKVVAALESRDLIETEEKVRAA